MTSFVTGFSIMFAMIAILPAVVVGVTLALSARQRHAEVMTALISGLAIGVLYLEAVLLIGHPALGDAALGPAGTGLLIALSTVAVLRFGHHLGMAGPLPWVATLTAAGVLGAIFGGTESMLSG
ncbi:MAG: hypothetical protein AAFV86_10130 [Pseudomonadota bacterium]